MSVLTKPNISLGDYEKQVLLELDSELTATHMRQVRDYDPALIIVFVIIQDCWDMKYTVEQCKQEIYTEYDLPLHECALEGVAVLSNN